MTWLCQPPTVTTYRINLLCTTIVAFKQRLQKLLQEKYSQPPNVFDIPEIPEVLCISPVPLPPILHSELLEKKSELTSQKEVIVDSRCGAALLRGAHLYAPGVLAMEAGTKLGEQVHVYADLEGKCKKGTRTRYESSRKLYVGEGVVRMQRYQLYGPATVEAVSPNKIPPESGIAVEMVSNVSNIPALGDLSSNEALLQNLPSIVCVRVLDPKPGEHVLDMCAAPGNKTTHIAEMMRDNGQIVALDKITHKITSFTEKIKNNGLKSVRAYAYDATKACCSYLPSRELSAHDLGPPPYTINTFDRILLDAPCSALGNRPLLAAYSITTRMLESYPKVQRKLFEAAVPLLKPQGVLVYSTCTVTEAENEAMVTWALNKFPQLKLVPATPRFGSVGLAELGLDEEQRQCVQRFGPTAKCAANSSGINIDTVGFFIAKFMKQY